MTHMNDDTYEEEKQTLEHIKPSFNFRQSLE